MINHFYDLINEDQLPTGSKFVDPYDHTAFTVEQGESLSQFINKIQQSRAKKKYPTILDSELKHLVSANLFESCPKQLVNRYFEKRAAFVHASQIVSVARALAVEATSTGTPNTKLRISRAEKCLDNCTFHKNGSSWSKLGEKLIQSFVGLNDLKSSEQEKALGTCSMCGGCALQTKVRFNLTSVLAALTPEQISTYLRVYGANGFKKCWIFKEALQDAKHKELLRKKILASNLGEQGVDLMDTYLMAQTKAVKI